MKYPYLALALVLASFTLLAQHNATEKFIEVMVEDTLKAEPDYLEYSVRVVPYIADEEAVSYRDSFLAEKQQKEVTEANDKLLQVMKKHKIRYKSAGSSIYLKVPGPTDTNFEYILSFNNIKQLSGFYEDIKGIQQIEGDITFSRSSKSEAYEQKLTERLIEKARNKANLMARSAQVKLGSITQIRETDAAKDAYSGSVTPGWTVYPPLGAITQNIASELLHITYKRILIVRFVIEN